MIRGVILTYQLQKEWQMKIVTNNNGELMTTSKIISDVFGKAHRDVCRAVNQLDCSDEFRARNYAQSSYTSPQQKVLKCFAITRDGFSFLCMGFTGKKAAEWKEKYINTFNEMEKGLLNVDAEMTRLEINGKQLKSLGSEWGAFGRMINKEKKSHDQAVKSLIDTVQGKLDFNGGEK
jgi:Rha family phage regulatory protein